ncbi:MAG TPA: sugar phosphate isomerase/epimerase family protein [Fimbriiglobus sp.]|jgi:hexulose-6-phosphate isomerase
MNRRQFLAATAASGVVASTGVAGDLPLPKLKKAVKFSMINLKGATTWDKFDLVKKLGFEGVEIDSPSGVNRLAAARASQDTGVKIHGVIDNIHWTFPLSSPDPKVRAEGLAALEGALEEAKLYDATTVLLVPGVVNKTVSYEQCWDRSRVEVKKAIPLAEKLGVKIAIECVWNNFITKPEQMVEYVDSFQTPAVGAYMDCSNMIKFGVPSADWIRKLGKRMLKFDFKGYSKAKGWVGIGEGDENWPDILKACAEVGYHTWATAELGSCGEKELAETAAKMDKILQLK